MMYRLRMGDEFTSSLPYPKDGHFHSGDILLVGDHTYTIIGVTPSEHRDGATYEVIDEESKRFEFFFFTFMFECVK